MAFAFEQQLTNQNCLFGVIGDRALGHIGGDRLIGASIFKVGDVAESRLDVGAAQGLGRHAQRVAQGQAVERAKRTIERGHFEGPNCRCRRKCTGSSRLSTCSMKRFCLS
ncbi:hypothetical protein D3C76_951970 [compost metagenome]